MRLVASVRLAIPALLACAMAAHAQDPWKPDTQIGDFQFNMPSGWKRLDTRDGPTLVPVDVGTAVAYIGLLPPQPLNGDLRKWFDATWALWQRQFRVVDEGVTPQALQTVQGLERLRMYTRISSPVFGFSQFVFGAVRVGDQVEAYYFVSNANRWSYLNDLEAFEQSLAFANGPRSAADSVTVAESGSTAGGPSAGLSGLYVGYRMRGLVGLRSHFEYLVFFPDGNAIRMLPSGGLAHFDLASAVRNARAYCGRYRVDDDQLSITWGDNATETATRSGTTLKIGGDSYFLVSPSDSLLLDGTFRREGADLAAHFIRFSPDGSFVDNGMLPLVAYGTTPDQSGKDGPGQGTYTIAQNTLTLRYTDGRTIPLSFFILAPDEGGQRPTAIHVETYRLVRAP